jgi:hypothetical protein
MIYESIVFNITNKSRGRWEIATSKQNKRKIAILVSIITDSD